MSRNNINLSNEEFELVMRAVGILSHMYGVMGDMVDENYKKKAEEINELENLLCDRASDFGLKEITDEFESKKVINMESKWYKKLIKDLDEFEEYSLFDNLSNKLGWRDFYRKYSKKEIEEMGKRNNGYFGVDVYNFEKKYYDEFNKNGFERLEIKE